jgi:hypothetical protein
MCIEQCLESLSLSNNIPKRASALRNQNIDGNKAENHCHAFYFDRS